MKEIDILFQDDSKNLPALRRAQEIQKKASLSGFDWEEASGILEKIKEELGEVEEEMKAARRRQLEEELGDLLFAVVNLVRFSGFEAETTLHKMINRWIRRFRKMEQSLKDQGKIFKDVSFREMDALWEEIAESEK